MFFNDFKILKIFLLECHPRETSQLTNQFGKSDVLRHIRVIY